jgi:hypothetical protein
MAYENIYLRKQNVAVVGGYFWMMDDDTDTLVVKTDDGTLAYSYPLDNTIDSPVISMEYDGRNIWTMRNTGTNQMTIERWYINNYVCTLRNTFDLVPGPSHNYSSEAFTVEHYHTEFGDAEAVGQSILSVLETDQMESGYTVVLGPNSSGQIEEKTVSSASPGSLQINGTTSYPYEAGDPISFYKKIWLFNNYNGVDSSTGALYSFDAYTGAFINKSVAGSYKDILACTFFDVPRYVFDKGVGQGTTEPRYNSICYIKGTNMIFLDPTNVTTSFGSMTMDNLEDDQATNIVIYDVTIEGTNVYRLQRKATYYGATAPFDSSTYNYQLSTLNSFITSISLRAEPAILPANGVNTAIFYR